MRILYIHSESKIKYGAHYINDLIVEKLRKARMIVDTIYPKESIDLISKSLIGIRNILFFFSLQQKRKQAGKYDIIQGTTYTTLPFLGCGVPIISHFGSTTYGFLKNTPTLHRLQQEKADLMEIFASAKKDLQLANVSIRALHDIKNIEIHVAKSSTLVIATSERVRRELIRSGVPSRKVTLVHNAIEDYWFTTRPVRKVKSTAQVVYVGRMGDDVFTMRLKGINRLIYVLRQLQHLQKHVIGMCSKVEEYSRLLASIPNTKARLSVEKRKIPTILKHHYGDLYINTGRYEGFCLSLVEAMSQGLVPVTFPIGIAEEIIENGRNGYIVHSVDEMVERITFLQKRKRLRARMAARARSTAKRFTSKRMTEQLIEIYASLAQSLKRAQTNIFV